MPTITVNVDDDLKERMEKHPEINWSEVTRQAIEEKIEVLEVMDELTSESELTESDGAVQMFAVYDREHHRFEDVAPAWEEQDFLKRIAELVAGDCSLHEAVDWTDVKEAERYTIAQWADIRGVTEDAVRSNVNSTREKLLAEEDRESSGESP